MIVMLLLLCCLFLFISLHLDPIDSLLQLLDGLCNDYIFGCAVPLGLISLHLQDSQLIDIPQQLFLVEGLQGLLSVNCRASGRRLAFRIGGGALLILYQL